MRNMIIQIDGDKQEAFLSLISEMQEIVNSTISGILNCYGKKQIEISNWVAIMILKRIVESTKAGVLLISNGFERDASTILTNQIELRLDISYLAQDYNHAIEWINHNNEHRKPWKVSELFKEIFEDKDEFESEKEMYKRFSMVKHGNPVGETFCFPIAVKNGYLTSEPREDILSSKFALYIFAFSSELFRALKAAIVDFKRCGFDVIEYENRANFINSMLNDLYYNHTKEQISLLMKIKPKPELCNSCCAVPEGNVEINCLLRRSEVTDNFACNQYKQK